MQSAPLRQGAVLMLIGSLAFIGYAVVFLFRNFAGAGFELGVDTLNGVTRDNLNSLNPAMRTGRFTGPRRQRPTKAVTAVGASAMDCPEPASS